MDSSNVKQLTKISKYFKLYNRSNGLGAKINKPRLLNKSMAELTKPDNSKSTHDLNRTSIDSSNVKAIDKFPKLGVIKQSGSRSRLHSS